MGTTSTKPQDMTTVCLNIPTIDLKRFKGIAKAMGWLLTKTEKMDETSYISSSKAMLDIIAQGKEEIKLNPTDTTNVDELWK